MTVTNILKNRMYCGDMVQGRYRVKSYKVHVQEVVPEDEWYIVENTHEAIIEREIFEAVQRLLLRDTRTAPQKKQVYLFSGFLRCAAVSYTHLFHRKKRGMWNLLLSFLFSKGAYGLHKRPGYLYHAL